MGNPIGKWFEIFRTGTHTDSAGAKETWTESQLDTIVGNFSGETPITIRHPEADPVIEELRWGVLDGIKREGKSLFARIGNMVPELGTILQHGMLPQRSVGLSGDGSSLKLSHLALLGVTPPAVKGMEALAFKAADKVRTFEADGMTDEPMEDMGWVRKALSSIMSKMGITVETAYCEAAAEVADIATDTTKEIDMSEQEKKDLEAKVAAAEAALVASKAETEAVTAQYSEAKAKLVAIETEKVEAAKAAVTAEREAWFSEQVKANKCLPAEHDSIMLVLGSISAEAKHEFSEGDKKVEKTAAQVFRASIEARTGEAVASGHFAEHGKERTLPGGEDIRTAVYNFMAEEKKAGRDYTYNQALPVYAAQHPELNK